MVDLLLEFLDYLRQREGFPYNLRLRFGLSAQAEGSDLGTRVSKADKLLEGLSRV